MYCIYDVVLCSCTHVREGRMTTPVYAVNKISVQPIYIGKKDATSSHSKGRMSLYKLEFLSSVCKYAQNVASKRDRKCI